MTASTTDAQSTATAVLPLPYPPSWLDRLVTRVSRLVVPSGLVYGLALLLTILLNHLAFWLAGALPAGELSLIRATDAVYPVGYVAFYHYLRNTARHSFDDIRPMLDGDEGELAAIRYHLAHLPLRVGRLTAVPALALAVLLIRLSPLDFGLQSGASPSLRTYQLLYVTFVFTIFFSILSQTIRQLRIVGQLHRQQLRIDIFNLKPTHAFSNLTAQTAIGVVLLIVFNSIQEISGVQRSDVVIYGLLSLFAVATFAIPLLGLRQRLEEAKEGALAAVNGRLKSIMTQVQQQVDDGQLAPIKELDMAMSNLLKQKAFLEAVSTLPWEPRALRSLASTLLLPIFLWLVTRLLEQFFM